MNVLVEFSRSGLPQNETFISEIEAAVVRKGHRLIRDLLKESRKSNTEHLPHELFNRISKSISDSQAVIIEGSEISLSLGYILTESISLGKPVLFIRNIDSNLKKSRFADTIKSKLLTSAIYKNRIEMLNLIDHFLDENKHIKTRFNLVLSNEIDSYITEQSRRKNISKTEFCQGPHFSDTVSMIV